MKKVKIAIIGAGPSGLTLANALKRMGLSTNDLIVIEKESAVGGLCRSEIVDGAPLDIGGGHFLDVKRKNVIDFIFDFMPECEWNLYDRVSKIRIHGREVDHPIEANLWQLPVDDQADYLESIAQAGCMRGEPMPSSFVEWIRWKLGEKITKEYMLPYNRKIWAMDPELLGTYWLHKLPNVSFREILLSCLHKKPMGTLPAHGNFFYPKNFGYGEVWRRMGLALGDSLVTNCKINNLDLISRSINETWQADLIVTTIPWTMWSDFCELPAHIAGAIKKLRKASIDIDYHSDSYDSNAHWIYEPDEKKSHHRLLLRANFFQGSRGFWTETNSDNSTGVGRIRFRNEYAYPINTLDKPNLINLILSWAKSIKIIGLGRWGRWDHMNSDVAVDEALKLADQLRDYCKV